MNVWSLSASISVTSAYIFTQFGQNTITTLSTHPNSQIHIIWKSKMAAAAILNFQKNVNNSGLDKVHQILCEDASRPCRDDHVTKDRNRKLIPVTSSNERLKHKCVDLSYYNIIWTKFGTDLKFHTVYTPEWSNSQPQNARCRLPPFWIFRLCEIKKMLVAPDWMKIYASNFTE